MVKPISISSQVSFSYLEVTLLLLRGVESTTVELALS
jgi:hypothetical protein